MTYIRPYSLALALTAVLATACSDDDVADNSDPVNPPAEKPEW